MKKSNLERTKFTRSIPIQLGLLGILGMCQTVLIAIRYIPIGLQKYLDISFVWGKQMTNVQNWLSAISLGIFLYILYLWLREFRRYFRNGVFFWRTMQTYHHLRKIRNLQSGDQLLQLQNIGVCIDSDGIIIQFVIPIGIEYRKILIKNKQYLEGEIKTLFNYYSYSELTEKDGIWTMTGSLK